MDLRSCIAFMNTVDKSRNMAADLQTDIVKKWVSRWLSENAGGRTASDYSLEHLDASSNAAARETTKGRLADADAANPHGIINIAAIQASWLEWGEANGYIWLDEVDCSSISKVIWSVR